MIAHDARLKSEPAGPEEQARSWHPTRPPEHRIEKDETAPEPHVVVAQEDLGIIRELLKRPFVRLLIGLGVFIFAAIIYEVSVNYGQWTERQEKAKATKHKGLTPVQKTPDGVP